MERRFIDRKDKKELIHQSDFRHRDHGVPIMRVVMYFVAVLLATVILLNKLISKILFMKPNEAMESSEIMAMLGVVFLCAITVGVVALWLLYRIRRTVLETEFQSLIFASCMRVDSKFCLIVHRDRKGIYCDYNFSEMFAHLDTHDDPFHKLLASQGLRQEDEDRLHRAIDEGKVAEFSFILTRLNGDSNKMRVTLHPIERPKGFFLIRGF